MFHCEYHSITVGHYFSFEHWDEFYIRAQPPERTKCLLSRPHRPRASAAAAEAAEHGAQAPRPVERRLARTPSTTTARRDSPHRRAGGLGGAQELDLLVERPAALASPVLDEDPGSAGRRRVQQVGPAWHPREGVLGPRRSDSSSDAPSVQTLGAGGGRGDGRLVGLGILREEERLNAHRARRGRAAGRQSAVGKELAGRGQSAVRSRDTSILGKLLPTSAALALLVRPRADDPAAQEQLVVIEASVLDLGVAAGEDTGHGADGVRTLSDDSPATGWNWACSDEKFKN